jgi:hypothetical protein
MLAMNSFNSPDECQALDRLRLPLPARFVPHWCLHVVQVRPGAGDRVYDFCGRPDAVGGAFALYPDDLWATSAHLGSAHAGAWPCFRKTPRPFWWLRQPPRFGAEEFVLFRFPLVTPDVTRGPLDTECWYYRFDEGDRVIRHFAWHQAAFTGADPTWRALRSVCYDLAQASLRFTRPVRRTHPPPSAPPDPSARRGEHRM